MDTKNTLLFGKPGYFSLLYDFRGRCSDVGWMAARELRKHSEHGVDHAVMVVFVPEVHDERFADGFGFGEIFFDRQRFVKFPFEGVGHKLALCRQLLNQRIPSGRFAVQSVGFVPLPKKDW